jgi:hypothetical protein
VIRWADRKRAELRAKLTGLEDEFAAWRRVSEPGEPMERNHSQVRALLDTLAVPVETVRGRIEDSSDDVRSTWARTERVLLSCHEIWDYFRQRLCLRRVDFFVPYLDLADDFAYACYRPAQVAGTGAHNVDPDEIREPPLTSFTTVSTPYAVPRGSSYASEVGNVSQAGDTVARAIERLPVPVVGVPWFQIRHLPDALILGHEVGHLVETDLRLTTTLRTLLAGAVPPGSVERWQGWLGEAFGDVYGALCGGPAFGRALLDFAATGPVAFRGSRLYPPLRVRVRLVAETMAHAGAAEHRDDLLAYWGAEFGGGTEDAFDGEAAAVAAALVAGPYPQFHGRPLTAVADFRPWYEAAEQTASALLRGSRLSPGIDIRCLVAAAGVAFARAPERYVAQDGTQVVLRHAHEIATRGIRGAGAAATPFDRRSQRLGADLLAALDAIDPDRS